MRKSLFVILLTCFVSGCGTGEERFFSDPEKLKIVIYPGNSGFSLFHASTVDRNALSGYDFAGIATSGKPSKNRWHTRLLIPICEREKTKLNFIMTISDRAVKPEDRFSLQLDSPLFRSPEKLLPLSVIHQDSGILVFKTDGEQDYKSATINLQNHTVQFSWLPNREFHVLWKKDGFDVVSGNETISAWLWNSRTKIGFRACDGGRTAIYEKSSSFLPFLYRKELFYVQ